MCGRPVRTLLCLGSFIAMMASARAEVPLDKLTGVQIRDAVRAVPNAPDPAGITYTFANDQPSLVWALPAAQVRGGDLQAFRPTLVGILNEAMVQRKLGPDGTPWLTQEDMDRLAEVLVVQVAAPAPQPARPAAAPPPPPPGQPSEAPNTPPVLIGPFEITAVAGASAVVWFEVADRQSPAPEIQLSVNSLDRGLIPQQNLRIDGNGPKRSLTIATIPDLLGTARMYLTATDAHGVATRHALLVRLVEAPKAELARVLPPPPPRIITDAQLVAMWNPCGGCGALAGPSMAYAAPMTVVSGGPVAASVHSPGGVVTRQELIKGRTINDGPSLFNAAYEYYWAGDYAQALEAAAAGAELSDDPRSWDYVALSSIMMGDMATAEAAARYSEAKTLVQPMYRPAVGVALTRAQGPVRSRLNQFKSEVSDRFVAMNVLAMRPGLGFPRQQAPSPSNEPAPADNPRGE